MIHTGILCFTATNIGTQHTTKQGLEHGSPITVRPILAENTLYTER